MAGLATANPGSTRSNAPSALDPLSSPATLEARITGLGAGEYKLHWRVLAADGHIARGEISFPGEIANRRGGLTTGRLWLRFSAVTRWRPRFSDYQP